MSHVVAGAGATGVATARLLAEAGETVRLISRRGRGPEHPLIERVAADVADVEGLIRLSEGATTVFNCVMPAYHTWPEAFPPLSDALLTAAERAGAGYVMLGNTYGYGPVSGPITPDLPLVATGPKGRTRAAMWRQAAEAHREGRVRATELRAGGFLGPGAVSLFTLLVQPQVMAGVPALMPGDVDAPFSYSYALDVARALVALGRDERAWGRAWHAPCVTSSVRELATRVAQAAGAPAPRLESMTTRELSLLSLTSPLWGELWETAWMHERPYLLDWSETAKTFGLTATPLDDIVTAITEPGKD